MSYISNQVAECNLSSKSRFSATPWLAATYIVIILAAVVTAVIR